MLVRQYNNALARAKELPWDIVAELTTASTDMGDWPAIGLAMDLTPASDSPDETRGTLSFKVLTICLGYRDVLLIGETTLSQQNP